MKVHKQTILFVLPLQDKQFKRFILLHNNELNILRKDLKKLKCNALKSCISIR